MVRTIVGFRPADGDGWVAELSCLHTQHVRHRPPFQLREWVLTEEGRADRVGSPIECPLCDRAELPADLEVVRALGPFDQTTLPAGLGRAHRVADGMWGRLTVTEGEVTLTIETEPPLVTVVGPGQSHPIPPAVDHAVALAGPARLAVELLARPAPGPPH
ncbi:MAG: DUF3565 domain-containing protein [Actinomycetota bacterium]